LIYTNRGTLFAIAFDVNRLETRGTAVPILEDVAYSPNGGVDLDFAQNGALVYRPGGAAGALQQRTIQRVDGTARENPCWRNPAFITTLGFLQMTSGCWLQ
jgi:hypothetical protein